MTAMIELTEYEMICEAIQSCAEDGIEPSPALLALKAEFESGHRQELRRHDAVERGIGHRPVPGQRAGNGYVRQASDKQVAFVNKLLASRVLPTGNYGPQNALARFREGTANLRHVSDLIDWLLGLPVRDDAPDPNAPSQKQLDAFTREIDRRQVRYGAERWNMDIIVGHVAAGTATKRELMTALDILFNSPFTPRPQATQTEEITAGIYLHDGEVYKVQKAIHGSGHVYAKHLSKDTGKFEYAAGVIRKLTQDERMTLEQAKEYGAVYGVCCNCARTLTNEDSIEAGIGPVCAKKFA